MIFTKQPQEFDPIFEVVGCFCEFDKKLLLLLRHGSRPQGETWGLPSGKIDTSESLSKAMHRELSEETGIIVDEEKLDFLGSVFVKYPTYDFMYHMFKVQFTAEPHVSLQEGEHTKYQWMGPKEAMRLPNQIEDLDACIALYYT